VSLNDDDLLRPGEVAQVFGVRTATAARWAREGRLVAVLTPGGHRRYRRADVQALVDAEAAPETPEAAPETPEAAPETPEAADPAGDRPGIAWPHRFARYGGRHGSTL
jgi:excisionase family DNA binding protein